MIVFMLGFTAGAIFMAVVINICVINDAKRRSKRATEWQRTKKSEDKEIKNRWGI